MTSTRQSARSGVAGLEAGQPCLWVELGEHALGDAANDRLILVHRILIRVAAEATGKPLLAGFQAWFEAEGCKRVAQRPRRS